MRSWTSYTGAAIFTFVGWVAAITLAQPQAAFAQTHHGASGLAHGIPDFCAGPTITSVASGNWSTPSTWSPSRVPQAGDKVAIGAGTAVTYDVVSDASIDCVGVNGILRFRNNGNTRLKVANLMVNDSGALEVGTSANPIPDGITAEIIIADKPLNTATDPEQFGTAIIGFGRVSISGSPKAPTFTRLAVEPMAGQTLLQLTEAPSGWKPGDLVIVPDTRQLTWGDQPYSGQWEERYIASVSGTQVTLTQALSFNHKGARDMAGTLNYLPHVGNMSRNVVIRSENPAGTRGHGLFSQRADVDIRYSSWWNMGRTLVQPLDSTTFQDGTDNVTHVGTNQIGKYPIHLHHVFGPSTRPANGYQFTLIGNAIYESTKWGVTIHNSHFGLVQDNIVFNSGGACFMAEDGSESQNVFNHNFAVRSWGEGGREGGGREGTGFWFRGADNIVTNNVAANIQSNQMDAAYGYKYFLEYLGNVRTPKFPGADTTVDANVTVQNGNAVPVRKFENNEIYGATESGLTFWWIGSVAESPVANMPESVFKNLVVWHVFNRGVYHYPAQKITVDGLIVRSSLDEMGGNGLCCQLGIDFGDYYGKDITYRNVDIQGRIAGIAGSILTDNSNVTIENSYLANQINFTAATMSNVAYSAEILKPRHYVFRNVRMVQIPEIARLSPSGLVVLGYSADPVRAVTLPDDITFIDFQGVVGDNFRVFYTQQAPSYIVPQTIFNDDGTRKLIGAPVAGLTNQQAWAQYGVAVAGSIATCATARSGFVNAFTCTGGTPPAKVQNFRIVQ
jgi:hypothetical protein